MLFQIGKLNEKNEEITIESFVGNYLNVLEYILDKNNLYCKPLDEEARISILKFKKAEKL
jgi:hypothetical protein